MYIGTPCILKEKSAFHNFEVGLSTLCDLLKEVSSCFD